MRHKAVRAWSRVALGAALAPLCWLAVAVALAPMPPALLTAEVGGSVRVLDRHGKPLHELGGSDGRKTSRVALASLPREVPVAMLAAEDARFRSHPGVDPLAMIRALGQGIVHGRIVSGASTITQQLARTVVSRPRTLRGKLIEIVTALRIERSLGKDRILEEYLSRVQFGPNLVGIDAASRRYFDKPASSLGLSEAAALAAIPRGPTLYDPIRGRDRLLARRNRVLERMRGKGVVTDDAIDRARAEPLLLQTNFREGGAEHLAFALRGGQREPELSANGDLSEIVTTLDASLQREVSELSARIVKGLVDQDATACAALVVDNQSGEVLAYVGSHAFFDAAGLGQNDGTRALRQPGSALKPFVYAAAIEKLGYTPATLLPDVEIELPTDRGVYAPRNYDGRFHGPVRLREALGSSLNVPAVVVAQRLGPGRVLSTLRAVGLASLTRDAAHYGAAIALGDGEVSLSELAEAYVTLANDGLHRRLSFAREARRADGTRVRVTRDAPSRALLAETARTITDVLADPLARVGAFGRGSVLELPFPVAAKTGTSKGYRDNWTVGYTREVTVAVWVGNFDGRPMLGSSGVTGAGPLFRDVMLAAMRGRSPAPLVSGEGERVELCSLSGKLPGAHCAHRVLERFSPGRVPHEHCDMHVQVAVDPANGLRAGPACRDAEQRVFERHPARFAAWARRAGRPVEPDAASPRCPVDAAGRDAVRRIDVAYPSDGARFVIDPAVSSRQQAIVISARVAGATERVSFEVDGRVIGDAGPPHSLRWPLRPGKHRLVVVLGSARSEPVTFRVD